MATTNSGLPYANYQCKNESSRYNGKWYARARHLKTLTFNQFIQHIAEHGSNFTRAEVAGVAYKMQDCLLELLLAGNKVQFGEIGTFYLSIQSKPADTLQDFNVSEHIKGVKLNFAPNRANVNNLTAPSLLKLTRFINVQDLITDKERSEYNAATEETDPSEP